MGNTECKFGSSFIGCYSKQEEPNEDKKERTSPVKEPNQGNQGISAGKLDVKGDVNYELQDICSGANATFTGSVCVGGTQTVVLPSVSNEERKLEHIWKMLQASLQNENEKLQIPRLPWLDDWELKFDKYYVELSIESKNDKETRDLHLHEIFDSIEGKVPKRILIEAPAGYGKSTLGLKFCFDHAKSEDYIRQFDAVILLRLREFQNTLEELIADTLDIEERDKEKVFEAIKANQSKVLFVFDGMDELPQEKYKEIISVLKGTRLPQSTVIVTSRVSNIQLTNGKTESSVTNLLPCMDSRIVIRGMTGENRVGFLNTYLNDTPDKLQCILKVVEKRFESLFQNSLFDCPLFLLLLVIVAEEKDVSTLTTKTELYKTLLNFMLRRMFAKDGKVQQKCDFFNFDRANPPAYVQMLSQFAFIARRAIDNRQYLFTADEIHSECGNDDILKLGILTQNDSKSGLKRKAWFEPVHLSFLEFAASYRVWISLLNGLQLGDFFDTRYIEARSTGGLSLPFLFGLCGKQLFDLFSYLGNGLDAGDWLWKFTYFEEELEVESQLKLCELAEALLPLAPTILFLPSIYYNNTSSILLRETLDLAVRKSRLKRIVLRNECSVNRPELNSEGSPIWPVKVKRKLDYYDSKVKDIWSAITTHQDIEITENESDYNTIKCIEFTLSGGSLEEQLKWLSNWLSIEGLLINKQIHTIKYETCFRSNFTEILIKVAELIRGEKLVSVKITCDCTMSVGPWNDFFQHVKKSTKLVDLEIIGGQGEPLVVDLSDSEEKEWQKLELRNVVPCNESLLKNSEDFPEWDVENVVKNIPGCVNCLRVEQDYNRYVFVQKSTSRMTRHLHEVLLKINGVQHLLKLVNWSDLSNLKVLAIEFYYDEFKFDEHKDLIASSLVSLISLCHPLLKLEFLKCCSDAFIRYFLKQLGESKCPAKRKQEQNSVTKLNTLVLSHLMGSEVELSESTLKLVKDMLLSEQLAHLWLSGKKYSKGYATPEFVSQFSAAEGFNSKLIVLKEEEDRWRPDLDYCVEYYVEISVWK